MGTPTSLVLYRILFIFLGCFVVASVIYTTATDGSPFRTDVLDTPWIVATWIDFYVNVVALSVWVAYKESSRITSAIWIVLLVCFGSAATCAYIVKELLVISIQDPTEDPIDGLLIRRDQGVNLGNWYVKYGKLVFTILGASLAAVFSYNLLTVGLPFGEGYFTPWQGVTLIFFYVNVFAISLWFIHKETSCISASIWIIFLIVLGSLSTCTYIVVQLSKLSRQDPVYHVLMNSSRKIEASASTVHKK